MNGSNDKPVKLTIQDLHALKQAGELDSHIESLKKSRNTLNSEVVRLEQQRDDVSVSLNSKRDELGSLCADIDQSRKDGGEAAASLAATKSDLSANVQERDAIMESVAALRCEERQASEILKESKDEAALEQAVLDEVQSSLADILPKLEHATKTKAGLDEQSLHLQSGIQKSQAELTHLQSEVEDATVELELTREAAQEQDQRYREVKSQLPSLLEERLKLNKEKLQLTRDAEGLQTTAQKLAKEVARLESLLAELPSRVESLEGEQTRLDKALPDLRTEHSKLKAYQKVHEKKLRDLRQREKQCEAIEEKSLQVEQQARRLDKYSARIDALRDAVDEQDKDLRSKKRKFAAERKALDERAEALEKTSPARLQKRVEKLTEQKGEAREQVRDLKEDSKDLKKQVRQLEKEDERLRSAVEDAEAESENATTRAEEADAHAMEASEEARYYRIQSERHEERLEELHEQVKQRVSDGSEIPELILEWIADESAGEELVVPETVAIVGHGPFVQSELDAFLDKHGISTAWAGDSDANVLITGRTDWTGEEFEKQINEARDGVLKIYSQEMFILALVTGRDPFESEEDLLLAFADGHDALEDLRFGPFEWPQTECEELSDEGPSMDHNQVGVTPVYQLGYKAGRTADLSATERRQCLEEAFAAHELPEVVPGDKPMTSDEIEDYMAQWGGPSSRKRLWRLSHHLAFLIRTRRNNPTQEYAVDDWAADLKWLNKKYFKNYMKFTWPE